MTASKRANRYGTLAERHAAQRYRLTRDGAHTSWCDAIDADGTPHEIKAAMVERADGSPGRFRVFEKYHEELQRQNGRYVFVAYKPRGAGITVSRMKRIHSSRLPGSTWYGAGGHRDSQQRKLSISQVFSR